MPSLRASLSPAEKTIVRGEEVLSYGREGARRHRGIHRAITNQARAFPTEQAQPANIWQEHSKARETPRALRQGSILSHLSSGYTPMRNGICNTAFLCDASLPNSRDTSVKLLREELYKAIGKTILHVKAAGFQLIAHDLPPVALTPCPRRRIVNTAVKEKLKPASGMSH